MVATPRKGVISSPTQPKLEVNFRKPNLRLLVYGKTSPFIAGTKSAVPRDLYRPMTARLSTHRFVSAALEDDILLYTPGCSFYRIVSLGKSVSQLRAAPTLDSNLGSPRKSR